MYHINANKVDGVSPVWLYSSIPLLHSHKLDLAVMSNVVRIIGNIFCFAT